MSKLEEKSESTNEPPKLFFTREKPLYSLAEASRVLAATELDLIASAYRRQMTLLVGIPDDVVLHLKSDPSRNPYAHGFEGTVSYEGYVPTADRPDLVELTVRHCHELYKAQKVHPKEFIQGYKLRVPDGRPALSLMHPSESHPEFKPSEVMLQKLRSDIPDIRRSSGMPVKLVGWNTWSLDGPEGTQSFEVNFGNILVAYDEIFRVTGGTPPSSSPVKGNEWYSNKLTLLEKAAEHFWGASHVKQDNPSTFPKTNAVVEFLIDHGLEASLAKAAARIIRPEWAPADRGGRPEI